MVFSGLSPREPMWLFISCHSPSPASVPASSRTFSQKQQTGSTSFILASILRFSGVITASFSLMVCEFYLTGRSCAIGYGLILLSWFVRQENRKTEEKNGVDTEKSGKKEVSNGLCCPLFFPWAAWHVEVSTESGVSLSLFLLLHTRDRPKSQMYHLPAPRNGSRHLSAPREWQKQSFA